MADQPRKSRLGFLSAHTWLDHDGEHVWLSHNCTNGPAEDMLPWPTWRVVNGKVEPSISCDDCGLHYFAEIEPEPGLAERRLWGLPVGGNDD